MSEPKRGIELEIRATLAIDSEYEDIIAEFGDLEKLRRCIYGACGSSAKVVLPGGICATLRFFTPTPFDLRAAQLGPEALASVYVSPLPDEPDVQVVARWRYNIATFAEVFSLRRLLPALQKWRAIQILEQAQSSPSWVLGVCHPVRAAELVDHAERAGLKAVIEPFVQPEDESAVQFGARWGCETPASWKAR